MSDEIKDKYAEKWAKDDAQRDELHAAQMADLASARESRAAAREHDAIGQARHAEELANCWAHRAAVEETSKRHAAAWERIAAALEKLVTR